MTLDNHARLFLVKLAHTVIWAFFVLLIAFVVYAGIADLKGWSVWVAAALVTLEGAVILLNHGHCPLTPLAAKYTDERQDNFDIFLPLLLARYNKQIFTAIFILGLLILLYRNFPL